MAKRKLMFLFGSICILLIVAGYISSNWSADIAETTTGDVTTDDSMTGGDTEITPEDITTDDSTTGDDTDTTTDTSANTDHSSSSATSDSSSTTVAEASTSNKNDHEDNEDYTWDSSDVITITLNTDSISVDDKNVITIDKTTATITSAGTYSISGTLDDGQIIVDTNDEEIVRLILNGVNINSATNAPIYVEDADKTIIILADNTENYLTDNVHNEDNGTLCSKDDLTIYGDGSLTVNGNANDAIRSNDGLIIESGTITVTSVDDGIRGKDYLVIKGGDITVNSVGDGLKSDNDEEENKGYISIEDSTMDITSTQGDAITAQTSLLIANGAFTLTSGGGSYATLNENVSTKGLKAGDSIVIDGGTFTLSSSDDAIHSNGVIVINNGTFDVSSGDDGIHADTSIEINGGTIDITKSYEGIESAVITINTGYIQIDSSEDGISGKDYLVIKGGDVTVNSVGDGLKSDNDEEADKGYISIEDSTIAVTSSQGDAITAQTDLVITSGVFTLTSGGGSNARLNESVSTKGLKAGVSIVIDGGTFTLSSSDDAIHSNGGIVINGGTFDVSSGDDGIHADTSIEINGGTIDITKSFEGMESAVITINTSYIQIVSSDDGINLVGGNDGSTTNGGGRQGGGFPGGGGGGFETSGEYYLYIRGGFIYIDSNGDGIDSNGYMEMSDGVLIINGPTSNMNSAIDYGWGSFKLTGGTVVAVGSSGMAQGPSASSTQYSVNLRFSSPQSANTLVNIQTASGEDVLTFCPTKTYQSLVFSSPELAAGSYDVYVGGSSTGTLSYGLYENGTYSAGTKYGSFTLS
jgi:predicted secreted Zn-dependent protease